MARLARVVTTGVPHHVTQRGNARRLVFESDADRLVYLRLLESNCQLHALSVLGFCLMSNHVHLIVVPQRAEAMGLALRHAHGRYASYLNARHGSSGQSGRAGIIRAHLTPATCGPRFATQNATRFGPAWWHRPTCIAGPALPCTAAGYIPKSHCEWMSSYGGLPGVRQAGTSL